MPAQVITILLWFLVYSTCGSNLNSIYSSDATLTNASSPYYVVSNVVVQSGVTLSIENGVEIVFTGGYDLAVRGSINGCYTINSNDTQTRGLADDSNYIYIHSNGRNGSITFDYDTSDVDIKFCNVLFEGLETSGDYASTDGISGYYDNCEFYDIDYPIKSYWFNHDISVTDSYFHDFKTNQGDNIEFYNCLFEDFEDSAIGDNFFSHTAYVYNSTIIDTLGTASYCIASERGGETVVNNTISNCAIAIYLESFSGSIKYNTISNSSVGIKITNLPSSTSGNIHFNNFLNNEVNIELNGDNDYSNGYNNYWGVNNESQISDTIFDLCDGYSNGK